MERWDLNIYRGEPVRKGQVGRTWPEGTAVIDRIQSNHRPNRATLLGESARLPPARFLSFRQLPKPNSSNTPADLDACVYSCLLLLMLLFLPVSDYSLSLFKGIYSRFVKVCFIVSSIRVSIQADRIDIFHSTVAAVPVLHPRKRCIYAANIIEYMLIS